MWEVRNEKEKCDVMEGDLEIRKNQNFRNITCHRIPKFTVENKSSNARKISLLTVNGFHKSPFRTILIGNHSQETKHKLLCFDLCTAIVYCTF
jgi:hypothetical protein